jgi:di- and tripeptidase
LICPDINTFNVGSLSQFSSSRPLYPTRCIHTISQEDRNSVLSLAASKKYLFSGSQSSQIHVRKELIFDSSN